MGPFSHAHYGVSTATQRVAGVTDFRTPGEKIINRTSPKKGSRATLSNGRTSAQLFRSRSDGLSLDRRGGANEPARAVVIDREAMVLGVYGVADFNALHSRALDIVARDGRDLRSLLYP